MRPGPFAASVLLAALFAFLTVSRAETVRVLSGGETGEGWMFLDQDSTCKVVTAGHLVRRMGYVAEVRLQTEQGPTLYTGPPIVLSQEPDIAVLPVRTGGDISYCRDGRLSAIGVAGRVQAMDRAWIDTLERTASESVPAEKWKSIFGPDEDGIFALRLTTPGDQVAEGWSGSLVRDPEGPVGILVDAHQERQMSVALAVRLDVVRRLVAAAEAAGLPPVPAPPPRVPAAVILLAGNSVDAAAGPDRMLASGQGGWPVQPQRGSVVFVAAFAAPTQVREVTLAPASGSKGRIAGMEVATDADVSGDDWVTLGYCRASAGSGAVACPFLIRTVQRMRIVLKTVGDAPVAIGSFVVR